MVSHILRWCYGWVRVEAEGGYPERLLNQLNGAGVALWQVQPQRDRIRFSCPAKEYRRLRPMAHRACVRMRVAEKHGFPFWRYRYRHRKGLLFGLALYCLILAWFSPRIWVIQVEGNDVTSTEEILAVAEERGVRIGAKMKDVSIKELQLQGSGDLDTVAFITVNPSHCVARIQVTERQQPPEVIDLSQPSDLVAGWDGCVLNLEIRSGQPLVMEGEAVTAGTPLVTGRVQTEMGEKLYRSYGAVWAQTTRRITLSVPLSYTQTVAVGERVCRPVLTLFCWDFPLYSTTPLQSKFDQSQTQNFLTVGAVTLPLGITTDYYQPLAEILASRTEKEAEALARQQLEEQEQTLFLPNSYEQLTCTGRVQDGVYLLTATYRCRENIAVEVPLDSGLPATP